MTAPITPALTAEEWKEFTDDAGWLAHAQQELGNRAGEIAQQRMGTGRVHAAAALALHGQPFGFRVEDAKLCVWAAQKLRVLTNSPDDWTDLDDLAARLTALLPPEGA